MSQEGYVDPVTNDGPRFHSITPISELTELVFEPERSGQATKLSPSVVRNRGWGNAQYSHRPPRRPDRARGLKKNTKDSDLKLARSTTLTCPIPRRAPTPGSASITSSDL